MEIEIDREGDSEVTDVRKTQREIWMKQERPEKGKKTLMEVERDERGS